MLTKEQESQIKAILPTLSKKKTPIPTIPEKDLDTLDDRLAALLTLITGYPKANTTNLNQTLADTIGAIANCIQPKQPKKTRYLHPKVKQGIFLTSLCTKLYAYDKADLSNKLGVLFSTDDTLVDILNRVLTQKGINTIGHNFMKKLPYSPYVFKNLMTHTTVDTPFLYQGSKKPYIDIINYIVYQSPKYNTFIDLFGGSSIVSANIIRPRRHEDYLYVYNDLDRGQVKLIRGIQTSPQIIADLITSIQDYITGRTDNIERPDSLPDNFYFIDFKSFDYDNADFIRTNAEDKTRSGSKSTREGVPLTPLFKLLTSAEYQSKDDLITLLKGMGYTIKDNTDIGVSSSLAEFFRDYYAEKVSPSDTNKGVSDKYKDTAFPKGVHIKNRTQLPHDSIEDTYTQARVALVYETATLIRDSSMLLPLTHTGILTRPEETPAPNTAPQNPFPVSDDYFYVEGVCRLFLLLCSIDGKTNEGARTIYNQLGNPNPTDNYSKIYNRVMDTTIGLKLASYSEALKGVVFFSMDFKSALDFFDTAKDNAMLDDKLNEKRRNSSFMVYSDSPYIATAGYKANSGGFTAKDMSELIKTLKGTKQPYVFSCRACAGANINNEDKKAIIAERQLDSFTDFILSDSGIEYLYEYFQEEKKGGKAVLVKNKEIFDGVFKEFAKQYTKGSKNLTPNQKEDGVLKKLNDKLSVVVSFKKSKDLNLPHNKIDALKMALRLNMQELEVFVCNYKVYLPEYYNTEAYEAYKACKVCKACKACEAHEACEAYEAYKAYKTYRLVFPHSKNRYEVYGYYDFYKVLYNNIIIGE